MLIKINTDNTIEYPCSIKELKAAYPNTSFQKTISEEVLNSFSVYTLDESAKPTVDQYSRVNITEIKLVDGVYTAFYEVIDKPLEKVKYIKLNELEMVYLEESEKTIVDSEGVEWTGGQESAQKLQYKALLVEQAGNPSGKIFDANKTYHELSISDMRAKAVLVGEAYEQLLEKYISKRTLVESLTDSDAVKNVVW